MRSRSNLKFLYLIRVVYLIVASIFVYIQFQTVRIVCFYIYILISTHSHDYQPWAQYSEKQTSILTKVIEPETDFYPSVTVCAGERYTFYLYLRQEI